MRTKYEEYLRSTRWKRIRDERLRLAGDRCERCGATGPAIRLEVHHKHYEHLGNEPLSDLEVLCDGCHPIADEMRRAEKIVDVLSRDNISHKLRAGFMGWMQQSFDWDWADNLSQYQIVHEAKKFLSHIHMDSNSDWLVAKTAGLHWLEAPLVREISRILDDIDSASLAIERGLPKSESELRIEQFRKVKEREADMRLLAGIFARYHLDGEIPGCDFRLEAAGVAYRRYRIELNGETAGQRILMKEWTPRSDAGNSTPVP